MTSSPQEFYLPFIKKEQVSKDAFAFYFKREVNFDFLPGQYIRMHLPGTNIDGRGDKRPFTIASSPLEKEHIMIVTRIIQSAFKKRLSELSEGEKVKFYGPLGGFVLHEEEKNEQVFLAGGIGIT
ncbi:MAG: FAD-dependent oxidoreductase, partial [Candidatus Levybacteria bacterium]|nr:FAD-dependent oxidoreductase [Candidatus Levybacteria bacterium]